MCREEPLGTSLAGAKYDALSLDHTRVQEEKGGGQMMRMMIVRELNAFPPAEWKTGRKLEEFKTCQPYRAPEFSQGFRVLQGKLCASSSIFLI